MRSRHRGGLVDGVARLRARGLRTRGSEAEKRLWARLRRDALDGAHFRRQHPLYGFIVDFCCVECRLVVELDGESHVEAESYDASRTAILAKHGFRVKRFWNPEVMRNLDGVVAAIEAELKQTPPP